MPKFSPEKQKKRNFGRPKVLRFFEQDRLLFARVETGVTEFLTKTDEEEEKTGSEIFFQRWVRIRMKCHFLAGITNLGGEGV